MKELSSEEGAPVWPSLYFGKADFEIERVRCGSTLFSDSASFCGQKFEISSVRALFRLSIQYKNSRLLEKIETKGTKINRN